MKTLLYTSLASLFLMLCSFIAPDNDNPAATPDTLLNESAKKAAEIYDKQHVITYQQSLIVLKNLKFENNTLFIDMKKDVALSLGVPDSIYDYWEQYVHKKNEQIKKVIDEGGSYSFTNAFSDEYRKAYPRLKEQYDQYLKKLPKN